MSVWFSRVTDGVGSVSFLDVTYRYYIVMFWYRVEKSGSGSVRWGFVG